MVTSRRAEELEDDNMHVAEYSRRVHDGRRLDGPSSCGGVFIYHLLYRNAAFCFML